MDLGLFIAASGMVAEQTREAQLSANLANASTPGYKADRSPQHSFGDLLLSNTTTGQPLGTLSTGVQLGPARTDMAPAPLRPTGQPLDFGIVGAGFFAVRTPQGVRYTRDGQFTASASGQLVDGAGNPVLSQAGAPIAVGPGGSVSPTALGLLNVPGAVKQGENLYTGTPSGSAEGTIRQGALEGSGVDAARTMVAMIGSLRTFQSGQQAIQAIDQTLQAASTQVGSLVSS
jgi:flagellar basal-body rod protein FlgF